MSLSSWLYVSTSLLASEEAGIEVERIVDISRSRNQNLEVTGALLFTGKWFVQLLEGMPDGVSALQESIFRDKRHHSVTTIHNIDVDDRRFLRWSLAYAGPSHVVAKAVEDGIRESERDARQGTEILVSLLHKFSPLD